MRSIKLLSVGAMALALAGTQAVKADSLFTTVPTVHVAVSGVQSQAQLADTLRAQGYTDVVLAPVAPSPTHPHPELDADLVANPQATPVRAGWNGVAVKDGKTVGVYANLQN